MEKFCIDYFCTAQVYDISKKLVEENIAEINTSQIKLACVMGKPSKTSKVSLTSMLDQATAKFNISSSN